MDAKLQYMCYVGVFEFVFEPDSCDGAGVCDRNKHSLFNIGDGYM